jgi:hypothetical protein
MADIFRSRVYLEKQEEKTNSWPPTTAQSLKELAPGLDIG